MEGTKLGTMPLHGPSQLQGLLPSYCLCVIKKVFFVCNFLQQYTNTNFF
jgi:hypothetical protein